MAFHINRFSDTGSVMKVINRFSDTGLVMKVINRFSDTGLVMKVIPNCWQFKNNENYKIVRYKWSIVT